MNQPKLCECGCGEPTKIAQITSRRNGHVRGQPLRFVHGHNSRLQSANFDAKWIADAATRCHVWIGRRNRGGYGMFGKPSRVAHRVAWERVRGQIPTNRELDHLCRNRACVNVEHLELVTSAVNVQRGLKTKLTAKEVCAIRASIEPNYILAAKYGVSRPTISHIRHRRIWRNI